MRLARFKRVLARVIKNVIFKRRSSVLCQGVIERYTVVQRYRNEYLVRLICHCLKFLPSAITPDRIASQAQMLREYPSGERHTGE